VLGGTGKVSTVKLAAARRYEAAWKQYRAGNFLQALEESTVCEAEFGPAPAVQRLGQECEARRQPPPGKDWDEISRMMTK
jgi:hypothetical protein